MAIVTALADEGAGRRKLQLSSPVTLKEIGKIEVQTEQDIEAALQRARVAQRAWAKVSPQERAKVLERALQILIDKHEQYIDVFVEESGKIPI